jgi:hypothetical protein
MITMIDKQIGCICLEPELFERKTHKRNNLTKPTLRIKSSLPKKKSRIRRPELQFEKKISESVIPSDANISVLIDKKRHIANLVDNMQCSQSPKEKHILKSENQNVLLGNFWHDHFQFQDNYEIKRTQFVNIMKPVKSQFCDDLLSFIKNV